MEYGFLNLWYSGWVLVMYFVESEERGFEGVPCAKKVRIRKKKRLEIRFLVQIHVTGGL